MQPKTVPPTHTTRTWAPVMSQAPAPRLTRQLGRHAKKPTLCQAHVRSVTTSCRRRPVMSSQQVPAVLLTSQLAAAEPSRRRATIRVPITTTALNFPASVSPSPEEAEIRLVSRGLIQSRRGGTVRLNRLTLRQRSILLVRQQCGQSSAIAKSLHPNQLKKLRNRSLHGGLLLLLLKEEGRSGARLATTSSKLNKTWRRCGTRF